MKSYRKEDILDEQHWMFEDYRQRITADKWKQLLLNHDEKIIFRGRVMQLAKKNLGHGILEISKEPLK